MLLSKITTEQYDAVMNEFIIELKQDHNFDYYEHIQALRDLYDIKAEYQRYQNI